MFCTSHLLHLLSHPVGEIRDSFANSTCQTLFHVFSSLTFKSDTVSASDYAVRKALFIALETWYPQGIQIWRAIVGRCSCSIICAQFACRHYWATCAACGESWAFLWICRSLWQQSVAVLSNIWEQKLTLTTVCRNITTKIVSRWRRCHCSSWY